jgi:putative redox protein
MRSERFDFPGADGQKLAARLDLPDGEPAAYALFAHCFTCSKESLAASRIARTLTGQAGIATLRFDFTGLGSSGGEFANTGFSSNVEDLLAAVAHMRARNAAPALLIGHSLGGAAVLAAAANVPEAKAVVTISAPFDTDHVTRLLGESRTEIEALGEATVLLGGRPFTIRRSFLDDVQNQDQAARIGGLRQALLVLHAPADATVGIENASSIFGAARHPKSFVSLDDADHLLTRPGDAEYAANVLAAWAHGMSAPPPWSRSRRCGQARCLWRALAAGSGRRSRPAGTIYLPTSRQRLAVTTPARAPTSSCWLGLAPVRP